MQVEFRKTGQRRYAVTVYRDDSTVAIMDPAPGFDPLMPHDLLHFLVEQELNITKGIFGQLVSRGSAGTFRDAPASPEKRSESRIRRKRTKVDKRLLKEGANDCDRS